MPVNMPVQFVHPAEAAWSHLMGSCNCSTHVMHAHFVRNSPCHWYKHKHCVLVTPKHLQPRNAPPRYRFLVTAQDTVNVHKYAAQSRTLGTCPCATPFTYRLRSSRMTPCPNVCYQTKACSTQNNSALYTRAELWATASLIKLTMNNLIKPNVSTVPQSIYAEVMCCQRQLVR